MSKKTEWRADVPEQPGLYNCRVFESKGPVEQPLLFKKCPFTGRSYWLNIDGTDPDPNKKIEWRTGKVTLG